MNHECDNWKEGPYTEDQCVACWLRHNTGGKPAPTVNPLPLGDAIEKALSSVGVTKERVTAWLGGCGGCKERQEKLNALGMWAASKAGRTREFLERLIS